ncbi:MAG: methyl-accepting chemotaxis protein [Anaeromyxobacter sp.]
MRNVRIGTMVALAMGSLVVLLGVLAATSWFSLEREAKVRQQLSEETYPAVQAFDTLMAAQAREQQALTALLVPELRDRARDAAHKSLADGRFEMDASLSRLDKLPRTPEIEAAWTADKAAVNAWIASTETIVDSVQPYEDLLAQLDPPAKPKELAEARVAAWEAYGQSLEAFKEADARLVAARQAVLSQSGESKAAALSAERKTRVALVATAAAILVLGVLLTVLIRRAVARAVTGLVREAGALGEAVEAGQLGARASAEHVQEEFRPVVERMNEVMDAFARPIAVTVEALTTLAAGEAPAYIEEPYAGDFDKIKTSVNDLIRVVKQRGKDLDLLIAAAVEGRLDYRANPSRYQGGNARLITALNQMLDALVSPLQVAAGTVDRIARGDLPPPITAEYRGDFDLLKQNLNTCVAAVHALVEDVQQLAGAAVRGQLSVRADPSRHLGEFRAVVEGLNATLDAVVGPVDVAARAVEQIARGEIPPPIPEQAGDFSRLRDNLNTCIAAVNALVRDTDLLAQAALEGRLSVRADAARHQGQFREVVEGANRTVEALLAPVVESTGVLERLAARDLRARVTGSFPGDHARAKDAVNRTAEALHEALSQVSAAVDQVSGASAQIASSSQAVASGASEQASSLQETTSSIGAVAQMIERATDHAHAADRIARTARAAADEGTAAVDHLQQTMGRIKASAEGTSQIIRDVSDIAFQTNLLALNAAVEAARAGDAGRGFAVVAEEVRSLAMRAKEAAGKTEELIRQSVKETEQGEQAARQVSGQLAQIQQGVSKVSDAVAEIAAAAREQSSGIAQVNRAVTEMDKVTQQNAASAEESSSAASELSSQAADLASMVSAFRLEQGGPSAGPRAVAGAPRRPALAPAAAAAPAAPARPARPVTPAGRAPTAGGADPFPMDDPGEIRDF